MDSFLLLAPASLANFLDHLLDRLTEAAIPEWEQTALHARLGGATFEEVIAAIDRARPDLTDAAEAGLYQHWIAANPASPLLWAAWFNLGTIFARLQNQADAAASYHNALRLRPDLHFVAINLGLLFESMGEAERALSVWQTATQTDEARIMLETQQGRLLESLGRFAEAEAMLRRVLLTDPGQKDVVHHWVHLRQKTCQWPVLADIVPGLPAEEMLRGAGPFGIMALSDDIALQTAAAANWVARKTAPAPRRLSPAGPYGHGRIRLGYLSSDFCSHAMSYLITEVFERHDRTRFEIFGYCASRDDGTALRQRVLASFDNLRLIRDLSDEDAAEIIRRDEIDVLIDLNGITDGSRLTVLRWRPAPIQATYLGFIGPVPLPELDYLLCDSIVIPPEHAAEYQPKPLPIGPLYQANDSKRTVGPVLTRAAEGLPEGAFVFCCFSKHYKITEPLFGAWMEILRLTPHGVLWLAKDNEYSEANLRAAAVQAGIAPARLIVSERADPDTYMSRLRLADMFLDTFPYNGGTVASDALRMNLPLVTLCGRAFASRMATSLLHAIGAHEGITHDLARYTETALRLANDPTAYEAYKARFTAQAWVQGAGNIQRFMEGYEATLAGVVAQASAAQKDDAGTLINRAAALLDQKDWAAAAATTRRALERAPDAAVAHINLATALLNLRQYDEALASCRVALALRPQGAAVAANLGGAMLELGQWEEAVALCRQAIAEDPANASAQFNLSHAYKALNRLPEAESACRRAIALKPDDATYHFHLAHILLVSGQLAPGWAAYEWRWELPDFAWLRGLHPGLARAPWRGEPIAGKTILIVTEQGLGDIIQFVRFIPEVTRLAGKVVVACNPSLHGLLSTIQGVTLVSLHEPLPAFDVHCPLMSLPLALGTGLGTIPAGISYLQANPQKIAAWKPRLESEGLRVGLVWAGNPLVMRDRFRSPGLASVMPLFDVPGVLFVLLQAGPGRHELEGVTLPPNVIDLGGEIADLEDTAAIMSGLDLVISSCTGPLHLAGALGVKSWAMIPFAPHFPWLLGREDTLWYPTMRLYRQTQPGRDWADVVGRMAADLAALP